PWSWAFGDGTTSTDPSPSHAYAAAGAYDVHLTVTDEAHRAASTTIHINVPEAQPCSQNGGDGTSGQPQQPPRDGTNQGAAGSDSDGDGIPDAPDNCPLGRTPAP